jgi:hypothetical protein
MASPEFHPRETGSREYVQPWGSQEVVPYNPDQEKLWLEWADRLTIEQPEIAEGIVESIVKYEGEK